MTLKPVTATAPINIAVIKYWGKTNQSLVLPTNSSLSLTLNDLYSTTTVSVSTLSNDEFILNSIPTPVSKRMKTIISILKEKSKSDFPLLIVSENNFPTAAGLASRYL